MAMTHVVHTFRPARLIVDVIDGYALARGMAGEKPRPIVRPRFTLTGRVADDNTLSLFKRPLPLRMVRNGSGYELFFDQVDEPGRKQRTGLPAGQYQLCVDSKRIYQRAYATVTLGAPEAPEDEQEVPELDELPLVRLLLLPDVLYPRRQQAIPIISGRLVETIDDAVWAVADANVMLGEDSSTTTDADGIWVLRLPEAPPEGVPIKLLLARSDEKRSIEFIPNQGFGDPVLIDWSQAIPIES